MISQARFILSRSKVKEIYNELKEVSDIISYSYKTNPEVGKILEENTDSMFSLHSFEDISTLMHPDRILFFSQAWDDDEIRELLGKGISRFVIDNMSDLDAMLGFLKKHEVKVQILLRMKLKENTVQTGKHFVYGMSSSAINSLLSELRKNKCIEKLGIHFHRKTQNVSEWNLAEELEDTINADNWKNIDLVNIGGGLPVMYKNYSSSVLKGIFSEIKNLRDFLNSKGIKMIIEPGRYIAGPAVKLEATIKSMYDNNVILDCSVFNAAMDTFVAHIRLVVEGEQDDGNAYTIKGCTPDSMDIFRYKVFLKKPKVGDKIVFLNAGAYTYSTDFCNLPKLRTEIID
ncbi:MAG: decarboxylase [archaeon]